ncbi:MAG: hypothetical protein A3C93_05520 [Candidatus Lloydbacteria bacterium RIFCSPHIGHO2_02_FULL_54_17]|uniref:Uncharacterized protein n=1 Tax=Candidatus Lloydbacteria bacterium RIFCSPHIGHO2_02_FULL_54_17 TaxID=1798664 RepID=A0A1G2DAT7_9BACT|nr:MAG: hypothetical protein A3C93_05520 [Candidatus Lloydbacteria bacterium RIFCSPHIGHO2_02_FULL_54_17]OGZ13048.1 MAG: hypothetical protein A2948_03500 [Candidatus Lloydbacteria bacterium RIFCSPLOWO2_01_FULL_54_18]OGZ16495.1 MAG: hypothetical protein A3H76_04355 [Candidatus Lloydbacteria bacterium RIFCSPLOWO2_02_FULL_54_12]
MKNLVTKKNVFIVAVIGLVFSFALDYLRDFGVSYSTYKTFVEPLFFISGALLITVGPLLLVRDEVFSTWLKFAKWWLPLSLVLIILSPTDGSSAFFPALFSKELTSMWMGGLFVAISLLLIGVKSLQLRKKP